MLSCSTVNGLSTRPDESLETLHRSWRRLFTTAGSPGDQGVAAKKSERVVRPPAARRVVESSPPPGPVLTGLRMRLVATVFLATVPVLLLMYFLHLEQWSGFLVGMLALAAAWYGGERFIMRQLRALLQAAEKLAQGDLTSRTRVKDGRSELGQLARTFDTMAESLQERARENEASEMKLLNRAQQQAVVAAIGQFAMLNQDFTALLNQALQLVAETLEVPLAHIVELQPESESLVPRAALGWRIGPHRLGSDVIAAHGFSLGAYVLRRGEPVIIADMKQERRFVAPNLLLDHAVASGVCLVIATRQQPYGILGIYTEKLRTFSADEIQFLLAVANSLGMAAERRRTEVEIQKLAAFAQLNPNPAMELTVAGLVTYFNDSAMQLALSVELNHPRELLPNKVIEIIKHCLEKNASRTDYQSKVAGRTLSWSFHPVASSRVVHAYVEDITTHLNLESQLRQSQKMESIGQLAAGVAHDFNNMLTIIQGHAGMLMARPNMPAQALDSAQAVFFAAERAASLTRQLLMFSRKNIMQPENLDLRDQVANLSRMVQRLLGELITLQFTPPADLPLVKGDAGMMEQVLMNLCVNARDAMERGGVLTIELGDEEITPEYVLAHPDARAGRHVFLRLSDTGCGMDSYTVTRIFEPFFTTKEVGKGTGLGLATVYGIVKQHSGWIEVTSQPNHGTTFKVYLPATQETIKSSTENLVLNTPIRGGEETLLVVEDEPVLQEMAQLILEEYGYQVLLASNGQEALQLWERHKPGIDLLFTDMVMPGGLTGTELAGRLIAQHPQLRVIFASGYTANDINTDFLTRTNSARFLQKPYTRTTLARAVREALDAAPNDPSRSRPAPVAAA